MGGHVKLVEVENFKSYRGKQVIGPFTRFSAIVGPNGSGKSNLMDAISFVLGERRRNLRVSSLRDLVHGAPIGRAESNHARVTMVYGEEDSSETVFTRAIVGTTSEYRVDKQVMTFKAYSAQLAERGILTKAKNFLVFQGTVESIAMKTSKERARLLEQICESAELAEEYDKCKAAMARAHVETQFNYHRKVNITNEHKEVLKEKEEAEKYHRLAGELAAARTQLHLFLLFCNEQRARALASELTEATDRLERRRALSSAADGELRARKRDVGQRGRELQRLESAVKAKDAELVQARSQYIKAKESIEHRLRRAESTRRSLQVARAEGLRHGEDIAQLEREIVDVRGAWQDFERLAATRSQSEGFEIGESQVQEYYRLKEEVGIRAGGMAQELEAFTRAQKSDQERIELEGRKMKEVQNKVKQKEQEIEELQMRMEKLQQYIEKTRTASEELEAERADLEGRVEGARRRTAQINKELEALAARLGDARYEQHESARRKRRADALNRLKTFFPDAVFGRLVDLCQPTHRKYQLAVTKVLGRNMEAIIVDMEGTARDCIRYLKEQRCEAELFLPLNYLQVRPTDERLRELPGAKLLMDVVRAEPPQVMRALQFSCGSTLVCHLVEDARRIAFAGPVRQKCVSLDGTLFSKSGVVSGGSSDLKARARRWDDKLVDNLREKRERLSEELHENLRVRRKEADLRQLQAQLAGTRNRLKYSESDAEQTRARLRARAQEKSELESQLANFEPRMEELQESMAARENNAKEVTEKMNKLEDDVFTDFCSEAGVSDIREFEAAKLKWRDEVAQKRLEFDNQTTRLGIHLDYERTRLKQDKSKAKVWEAAIAKDEAEVELVREEERRYQVGLERLASEARGLNDQLLDKRSEVEVKVREAEEARAKVLNFSRQTVELQREATILETKLEQQRAARHNLLQACKLQDVQLPLIDGSLDAISQELGSMHIESTTETGASSEGTTSIYARESSIKVEYEQLEHRLKVMSDEDDIADATEQLTGQVNDLQAAMQHIAPNMKATSKLKCLRDKMLEVSRACERSRKRSKQAQLAFNEVKDLRFKRFNKCLEHVTTAIDDIYKKLSQNDSAQAFLGPENAEEPYLEGVNYNCVAPGKRYQPMDNLSGGERTVAALALLFAIHSYRPSPFFVLDEIDASLDNTNIGKVANYMKQQSVKSFQVILISLKEELFARADSLIGVYPEQGDCLISHVVTMDLSRFPDELTSAEGPRWHYQPDSGATAPSDGTAPSSSLG